MGRRKKEAIPEAGKKTKRRVKAKSEAQETAPKRKYERRKKGFNEIPSPEIIPINQAVSNLTSDPEMYFLPMAQDEIYLINPYACGVSSWLPKAKLTRRNCPFFSVELVLEGKGELTVNATKHTRHARSAIIHTDDKYVLTGGRKEIRSTILLFTEHFLDKTCRVGRKRDKTNKRKRHFPKE